MSLGLSEVQVGLLLTLTLGGDIVISLLLPTRADQMGRRRTLIVGALLMVLTWPTNLRFVELVIY